MLATLSQRSSASQLQVGMGAFTNDVTSILGFLTPPPPSVTKCHFLRLYFDIFIWFRVRWDDSLCVLFCKYIVGY